MANTLQSAGRAMRVLECCTQEEPWHGLSQVVACMAVLGPPDRIPDSRLPQLRSTLLGAVKPLNEMLSHPADPAPGRRRRQAARRGAR